jgi:glutamate/tyrosine decarboxylase-like PLP-dependent enzyme
MEDSQTSISIADSLAEIQNVLSQHHSAALPGPRAALTAASSLHGSLPSHGLGSAVTLRHLLRDITPGFNGPKTSANYYGFVTGGVLPVAEAADRVVSAWDQNVQVHLPEQSVATVVEARALEMLVQLLGLEGASAGGAGRRWEGKTFTTGATGSNVLGLACGREYVLAKRLRDVDGEVDVGESVGELGLLEACQRAGVEHIQVLTTMGHSSLSKAASIIGLGRRSVIDVGRKDAPWKFDFEKLEGKLAEGRTASIVAVSCGEVNTGRFATSGLEEMKRLRELCDRYGAWIHVDGGQYAL